MCIIAYSRYACAQSIEDLNLSFSAAHMFWFFSQVGYAHYRQMRTFLHCPLREHEHGHGVEAQPLHTAPPKTLHTVWVSPGRVGTQKLAYSPTEIYPKSAPLQCLVDVHEMLAACRIAAWWALHGWCLSFLSPNICLECKWVVPILAKAVSSLSGTCSVCNQPQYSTCHHDQNSLLLVF